MVYVPGFSTRLYPRKGGGGGGKTGSSGGGKTGSSGSSSSSSSAGRSVPLSGSTGGSSRSATTFGRGGGTASTIPAGQAFAGRSVGGGTRDQVYGSRSYGSGYPGVAVGALGVAGLGFPFIFWPVVWGGGFGYGAGYLHTREYGDADNSSRPGGPMTQTAFADTNTNTTFHLLADNTTVASLIDVVADNCFLGNTTALVPMAFNTSDPSQPRPEQAVQYYRASSIVLTLDGYNNTAALTNDSSLPPSPIPSWVNSTFLDCVNQTIGDAAPLVDGAGFISPSLGLLGIIWFSVFTFLAV